MTSGGNSYYYAYDGLGSVSNLTSASGTEEWTYTYQPFGAMRVSTPHDIAPTNPMLFTGQYLDTSVSSPELYDLRAREYDPASGRFLRVDPSENDPAGMSNGQSLLSPYVYGDDRPTVLGYPAGTDTSFDFIKLICGCGDIEGWEGARIGSVAEDLKRMIFSDTKASPDALNVAHDQARIGDKARNGEISPGEAIKSIRTLEKRARNAGVPESLDRYANKHPYEMQDKYGDGARTGHDGKLNKGRVRFGIGKLEKGAGWGWRWGWLDELKAILGPSEWKGPPNCGKAETC